MPYNNYTDNGLELHLFHSGLDYTGQDGKDGIWNTITFVGYRVIDWFT